MFYLFPILGWIWYLVGFYEVDQPGQLGSELLCTVHIIQQDFGVCVFAFTIKIYKELCWAVTTCDRSCTKSNSLSYLSVYWSRFPVWTRACCFLTASLWRACWTAFRNLLNLDLFHFKNSFTLGIYYIYIYLLNKGRGWQQREFGCVSQIFGMKNLAKRSSVLLLKYMNIGNTGISNNF